MVTWNNFANSMSAGLCQSWGYCAKHVPGGVTISYTDTAGQQWQDLKDTIAARDAEIAALRAAQPRAALCEAWALVEQTLQRKDAAGYPDWTTETDNATVRGVCDEFNEWCQVASRGPDWEDEEISELCDIMVRCVMRLARLGKVGYHDGRGRKGDGDGLSTENN